MKDYKEVGYVYILTNPSFREDWVKIGKIEPAAYTDSGYMLFKKN